MKKMEGRAVLCLILAAALMIGLVVFIARLAVDGDQWASFYANQHVYYEGKLAVGSVYDRNGTVLLENDGQGPHYNSDSGIRRSTAHVVGDENMNVATAVNYAFKSQIIGYNFITGTNGFLFGDNRKLDLTIDAEISKTAYNALNGRDGFVGVYNWRTGEIICMVSNPGFDPTDPPASSEAESGTFINKVISGAATPGSTFKLVTTKAALENIPDIDNWTFTCTGSYVVDGEKVTCQRAHGSVDLDEALSDSCNCAFGALTLEIGADAMNQAVEDLGLTGSYDINGIKTTPGSFNFDTYNINLAWAGVGQFEDQVNPMSMMVYMGAIAGGGQAASPCLIMGTDADNVNLLEADTARRLQEMMRNNVLTNYGDSNFPGLELHAKSGTAEGARGERPDAWFCGYSGDYAFVVCVENGGYGSSVAGPIANTVLQAIVAQ